MGGFGSSRWGWHRKKARAEHCRWFTVAAVVGDTPPAAGRTGTLVWRDANGGESSVGFAFTAALTVTLAYGIGTGAERTEYAYPLALVPLPTPNGGTRFLARCPLTVDGVRCQRRAAKLFQPPGSAWFGCRFCHRLAYRTQQEHDPRVTALLRGGRDALFELADDLRGLPVRDLGVLLFALTEQQRRDERLFRRLDPKPPPRRRKKK